MATYLDLLNIEPQVAAGIASIISAATGLTTYTQFDGRTKDTTPWIEVTVELGAHLQQFGSDGSGNLFPNAWDASVLVRVVTARTNVSQALTQAHTRAKVRLAMEPFRGLFTTELFPYHSVPRLWEQGTREDVGGGDLDESELSFSCEIHIRPDVLATVNS